MYQCVFSFAFSISFVQMSSSFILLTTSNTTATIGMEFSITCVTDLNYLIFGHNSSSCIIIGDYGDGNCSFKGPCTTGYIYTCRKILNRYTLTIPGKLMLEELHLSVWSCQNIFGPEMSNIIMHVNVPVSNVTITATNNSNPVQIVQDSAQQFVCSTDTGRPAPVIHFLLNGTNITSDASQTDSCTDCSSEKYTSTSILKYTGKLSDDGKILFCTAFNVEGQDIVRSEMVTISIIHGPRHVNITPSFQSCTINETDSIGPIYCASDCRPSCVTAWVGPNSLFNTSVLNLQNIARNQTGNYTCIASNIVGNSSSITLRISVNYGPRQVDIIPSMQSYTINETDSFGPISCAADCRPSCMIAWVGPNSLVNMSVLYLQNIVRDQTGNYTCIASNIVGISTSIKLSVTVNYGPMVVAIMPAQQSYTVNETYTVGPISCKADCKPTCNMLWKRQNVTASSTSVLNLQNINRSQTGHYSCIATNGVGSSSSIAVNIIVNYVPVVNDLSGNTTVSENSTVSILCTYHSLPVPEITWKFNNAPFTNEDVHIQTNNTFSKLFLPQATCMSMGKYMCEASNILGTGSNMFEVDVFCTPRIHPKDDSSVTIAIRDYEPMNITALTIAFPEPVFYWRLRNNISTINITNGITNKQLSRNMFSSRLFISSVSRIDFGYYHLYAQNGVGSGIVFIKSYHVISASKPTGPEAIFVVCYSAFATVIWKSLFNGGSGQMFTIRYWVSETSVVESSSNILDSGENSYHNITLDNLVPGKGYSFRVVATNKFGQSLSKMLTCTSSVLQEKVQDSQDNKTMLNAGIGLVVASVLLILVVVVIVLIHRIRLNKQLSKQSRSETYMDIKTQNPAFTGTYDTLDNENVTADTCVVLVSKLKNQDPTRLV